jgi:hypothetical protein
MAPIALKRALWVAVIALEIVIARLEILLENKIKSAPPLGGGVGPSAYLHEIN